MSVLYEQSWNCELAKPEVLEQFKSYQWGCRKPKQVTDWKYLEIMGQIH